MLARQASAVPEQFHKRGCVLRQRGVFLGLHSLHEQRKRVAKAIRGRDDSNV